MLDPSWLFFIIAILLFTILASSNARRALATVLTIVFRSASNLFVLAKLYSIMYSRKTGQRLGWRARVACYAPQHYYDAQREFTELDHHIKGLCNAYNNHVLDRDAPVDIEQASKKAGQIIHQQKRLNELKKMLADQKAKSWFHPSKDIDEALMYEAYLGRTFAYSSNDSCEEKATPSHAGAETDQPYASASSVKKRVDFSSAANQEVEFVSHQWPALFEKTSEQRRDIIKRIRQESRSASSSASATYAEALLHAHTPKVSSLNKRKREASDDHYGHFTSNIKRKKHKHETPWPEAYRAESIGLTPALLAPHGFTSPHRNVLTLDDKVVESPEDEAKYVLSASGGQGKKNHSIFTADGLTRLCANRRCEEKVGPGGFIRNAEARINEHLTCNEVTTDDITNLLDQYANGLYSTAFFARFCSISRNDHKDLIRLAAPFMTATPQEEGTCILRRLKVLDSSRTHTQFVLTFTGFEMDHQ